MRAFFNLKPKKRVAFTSLVKNTTLNYQLYKNSWRIKEWMMEYFGSSMSLLKQLETS